MDHRLLNNYNNNNINNSEIFDLDMEQENLNQSVLENNNNCNDFINELNTIKSIKF